VLYLHAMRPEDYQAPEMGRPRKGLGRFGFWYFEPAPIPRDLVLSRETVMALSAADTALGRLAGVGRLLRNPHRLVRPYVTREALASSRIEGTQASLSDVFQAAASGVRPSDNNVLEVQNYIRAMETGLQLLVKLPMSLRVIRNIHEVLLQDVRGRENRPGEFRETPVWIGSPTDTPENATFVPPLTEEMHEALRDWEIFANENPQMPLLVQCTLLHYQFETIHPFLDGNGRLGRLLIVFFLIQQGRLPAPLLYISPYLEEHRPQYYDHLQAVRERGQLQEWIQFFLTAVSAQAEDAVTRAEQLVDLRERYRVALAGSRSRAIEVVELMVENPILSTYSIQRQLKVTNQGALNLIKQLDRRGWINRVGKFGRGGRTYWVADEVYDILNRPRAETEAASDRKTAGEKTA
jgi:Fic family protein